MRLGLTLALCVSLVHFPILDAIVQDALKGVLIDGVFRDWRRLVILVEASVTLALCLQSRGGRHRTYMNRTFVTQWWFYIGTLPTAFVGGIFMMIDYYHLDSRDNTPFDNVRTCLAAMWLTLGSFGIGWILPLVFSSSE